MERLAGSVRLGAIYAFTFCLLALAPMDGPSLFYQGLQLGLSLDIPTLDFLIMASTQLLPMWTALWIAVWGKRRTALLIISATPFAILLRALSLGASKDLENWPIPVSEYPMLIALGVLFVGIFVIWAIGGGLLCHWAGKLLFGPRRSPTPAA